MAAFPAGRPLVSVDWLAAELMRQAEEKARSASAPPDPAAPPPLTILDASWFMPATGRSGAAEFAAGPRIPGSRFFDIDAVCDKASGLPHMLPSPPIFAAAAGALGIVSPSSPVLIYDRAGIFSAPRAWYTFLALGHDPACVAVLDGGLPAWVAAAAGEGGGGGALLETGPADGAALAAPAEAAAAAAAAAAAGAAPQPAAYRAAPRPAMVRDLDAVRAAVSSSSPPLLLVDARPAGRFAGTAPEPRAGLRSGHIPGAVSLPFGDLLDGGTGRYRAPGELREAFKRAAGFDPAAAAAAAADEEGGGGDGETTRAEGPPPVFTCGTGVTACILALGAAAAAGRGTSLDWAVYDGSWTEWAGREDTPKEPPGGGLLAE